MFEGGHCHCQQALSQTASSALCLCFLDSRWSKAAGGVTSCQPDLQYWFWATRLQRSSSHSVTFYKCPTFSGTFCSGWLMFIFFFALQLLYRARVCVVFDQKYSHRLFMSKWRAPSVDNWRDLILICTCVCDFFFSPISTGQSQCKEIPESNTDCLTERHHHHGHRDYRPHRRCLHIQVKKVKREESQSGWVECDKTVPNFTLGF